MGFLHKLIWKSQVSSRNGGFWIELSDRWRPTISDTKILIGVNLRWQCKIVFSLIIFGKISNYRIRFCITSLPHLLKESLVTKFNHFPEGALLHSSLIILNIVPFCKFSNPQSPFTSVFCPDFSGQFFSKIWFCNYLFTIFYHNFDQFISYEIIKIFSIVLVYPVTEYLTVEQMWTNCGWWIPNQGGFNLISWLWYSLVVVNVVVNMSATQSDLKFGVSLWNGCKNSCIVYSPLGNASCRPGCYLRKSVTQA